MPISATRTQAVLPRNENIPVRRDLTLEENRRTGVAKLGGSDFRQSGRRIYVTCLYRGKRIRNSFGMSASSYAKARRWQSFFKNLRAKEADFWYYAPHIYHKRDRFIVRGYRSAINPRKRTTVKILFDASTKEAAWASACQTFYQLTRYDPVRDGPKVIIKDFGDWRPPEFPDISQVIADAG